MLEHALNSTILTFSFALQATQRETMGFIKAAIDSKLDSGLPVVVGGAELHSTHTSAVFAASCDKMLVLLLEFEKARKSSEGPKTPLKYAKKKSKKQQHIIAKKAINNKLHQCANIDNPKILRPVEQCCADQEYGRVREYLGSQIPNDQKEALDALERCFKGTTKERFEELVDGPVEKYKIISKPSDVLTVKRFSFSIGNYLRFHGSSDKSLADYQKSQKLTELAWRTANDCQPPTVDSIDSGDIDSFNKLMVIERSSEMKNALVSLGWRPQADDNRYRASETVSYYRDGLNGRPDLLLRSPTGTIIGVAEFKGLESKPNSSEVGTHLKQPTYYKHLLGATEAVLYIYPKPPARFKAFITKVTTTQTDKASSELQNLKNNYAKYIIAVSSAIKF